LGAVQGGQSEDESDDDGEHERNVSEVHGVSD
jgi:hypothetical protein